MIGVPNVVAPWDELARKLLIHRQGWLSALRILLAESRITVPFAMGEPLQTLLLSVPLTGCSVLAASPSNGSPHVSWEPVRDGK